MDMMTYANGWQFPSFFNSFLKKSYYEFLPNHCGQRKSMLIKLEETCVKIKRSVSEVPIFAKVFLVLSTCLDFRPLAVVHIDCKNGGSEA